MAGALTVDTATAELDLRPAAIEDSLTGAIEFWMMQGDVSVTPARSAMTVRGRKTLTTILDAAEALFSEHGYDGVSLREIIARAEVKMGQLQHFFASKDDVFLGVLDRRLPELTFSYQAALSVLDNLPVAELSIQQVVLAVLQASRTWMSGGDVGWHRYLKLVALCTLSYSLRPFIKKHHEVFAPTNDGFIRHLHVVSGKKSIEAAEAAFYLLESSLIGLMIRLDVTLRQLARHPRPVAVDMIYSQLATYATGGIEAILLRDRSPRS